MENSERLDIGIIGCGGITRRHIEGINRLKISGLDVFRIKAVCDRNRDNARARAMQIENFTNERPQIYGDFRKMISDVSLDAVDICLPHYLHHTVAITCLQSGLHVFIEKPLAITMRAAKRIMETRQHCGRVLAVGENYRMTPNMRAVWWILHNHMIGSPRLIIWNDISLRMKHSGWRDNKLEAGGSWLFDGGVHLADLDRYQTGLEPIKVYGITRKGAERREGKPVTVDDLVIATIVFERGVVSQWIWSDNLPGHNILRRIIYCTEGSITASYGAENFFRDRLEKLSSNSSILSQLKRDLINMMKRNMDQTSLQRFFPNGVEDSFAIELYDFYLAVRDGRKPEVDDVEAYNDMAVPLSIYESSYLGEPVLIEKIKSLKIENYQREINESLSIT